MQTIQDIRNKFPEYSDLSDQQLADGLHQKFYSDMPIDEYYKKIGFKPEKLSGKEIAIDYLKSLESGVYKGASYIPGFLGDIEELGERFLPDWMTTPVQELVTGKKVDPISFPTSQQIRAKAAEYIPQLEQVGEYQPQTKFGEYIQTGLEFATPGLASKTKAARRFGFGLGLGGGGLYETVESISGSPGVATGVTVPAMLLSGFLAGPSTAAKLAERSLKGVDEKQIADAIKLEDAARIAGVKLLPGETLDNKMVAQLTEDVLKSDQGSAYIYEAIKNRPKEVESLVNKQADLISKMPESQREVFKMISETAKESIKTARKTRTNKAQEAGYKLADTESLPPELIFDVIDGIENIPAPRTGPSRKKLNQIKEQLIAKKIKDKETGDVTIIPETNINNLSSTYKQFRKEVDASNKDLVTGGDRFVLQDLRPKLFNSDETGALDMLGSALNTNKNFADANKKYAELTKTLVDVVETNVLPLSKKNLNYTKIEKFVFDPKNAKKSDIKETFEALNKQNPRATMEIANVYFRNAIENSIGLNKKGADMAEGFDFVKELLGKKGKKRENFLTVLDHVADAHNVNRKDYKVGFENMISILERVGRISNINKPGFDVKGIAARTLVKDLALAKTFNPLVRLSSKYAELKAGNSLDVLGNVMMNEQSTKLLVELGKTNPQSKAAINKLVQIIDSVSPFVERTNQPILQEQMTLQEEQIPLQ